jgi:hypothetical protein
MDYHFLKPKSSDELDSTPNFQKLFGRFLPVFLLAAFLPFLIGLVIVPPKIGFLTRADTDAELRVWFEPANIVMTNGSEAELAVVANFEADNKLIPEIGLSFRTLGGISLSSSNLTRSIPFSGKVTIGKVTVRATDKGRGVVSIPVETIKITAFEDPLKISTGDANIVVR